MANNVEIGVAAKFESADLERRAAAITKQFNAMGDAVAKATRQRFEPISIRTKEELDAVEKKMASLLKINGELSRRLTYTGQQAIGPLGADYSRLYTNSATRIRKMQEVLQYLGANFQGGAGGGRPQGWGGIAAGAAQAGLRGINGVTGGAGGVAANALGTGMSAGFGAGLMGLMGGMLALGVGKLAGAVTEKMDQAERNAISYDTLKRTLGDVNVSFAGLKAVVEGAAGNVKLTFDEAAKLGTQFAKLGNLTADQYKTLGTEIETGTGLSRAYGLDPSRGVGTLGTLRGMRLTENEQDSRKMALLIGETIARSNAFAKADEVMDAIAGYATQQTRASLGANVAGYAGMYSALTGSRIPGLDAAGTAGLLARVNASLSAGGAKGEASQFFSATIGARYGLDPFQMQAWREGGAFATLDSTFGEDGTVGRFGMSGPGGGTTWMQATLDGIRRQYGGNIGMMAHAASNHLGVNMSQALALMKIKPNEAGGMERALLSAGVNLSDLNAGGIGNLSKVLFGSDAERQAVASGLRGRKGAGALSADEIRDLERVMSSGSQEEQKELLTKLVATRDQEQTQGKDIRDSKALLDNIKTSFADRLIPLTQSMRDGIMYMAGGAKGISPRAIREQMIGVEVGDKYDRLIQEQENRRAHAMSPEFYDDGQGGRLVGREYAERSEEARRIQVEAGKEIRRLKSERDAEIQRRTQEMRDAESAVESEQRRQQLIQSSSPAVGGIPGVTPVAADDSLFAALIGQESGGRHTNRDGSLLTSPAGARGITQVMPGTGRDPGFGVAPLRDNSEAEYRRFGRDYLNAMLRRYGGDRAKALAAYNAGPGSVDKAVRRHGDNWLQGMPAETQSYVPNILGRAGQGTPIPENPQASREGGRFIFDAAPIEIIHKNERGEQIRPPQALATTIRPASPFGTERFS